MITGTPPVHKKIKTEFWRIRFVSSYAPRHRLSFRYVFFSRFQYNKLAKNLASSVGDRIRIQEGKMTRIRGPTKIEKTFLNFIVEMLEFSFED
jgi:hypothetical protein